MLLLSVFVLAIDAAIVQALRGTATASSRPLQLPLPFDSATRRAGAAAAAAEGAVQAAADAAATPAAAAEGPPQVALVLDALRLAFLQGSGSIK